MIGYYSRNTMAKILTAKTKYNEVVVPGMQEAFGYKNALSVPRLQKVVINVGIGKIVKETEKIDEVFAAVRDISGQQPVKTKAKKAIAGFKIREGLEVGVKVTLRRKRMWDFLDRLINVALPRTKDFQGIKRNAVDQHGNLNLGLKEHTIFPEIMLDKVKHISSLQVTVSTNATTKAEGELLFKLLGVPFQEENKQ